MKLLIVGSRSITDFDISPYIPADTELIISGGANGVDTLAERYADKHKISKLILRPQYRLYRRGAPLKRNDRMVELCDKALVFWDGKYTINYAEKLGKPVEVIIVSMDIESLPQ